jgi:anti-sigma B factor antagonist
MSETPSTTTIAVERINSAVVVRVQVKMLEEKELKLLSRMIDEALGDSGVGLVVIDLSRVQLLPSLGLGVLVQIATRFKSQNKQLRLAALTPGVRQVFTITKLDRVFELSDSVEAAIK